MAYIRRVVDDEIDLLFASLPALSLEGPKGCGKTETALRRARTVYRLDDAGQRELITANPGGLASRPPPTLVDEWQRLPESWDVVRRAVDQDRTPGRFLLTGSVSPDRPPTHSGAGRIITLRMRPLSLAERQVAAPTVSMANLVAGGRGPIEGETTVELDHYAEEIVASGFPGLSGLEGRLLRSSLDGYIDRIVDYDIPEAGRSVRNPSALRRWMAAYAAATATTTTYERLRDAATGGQGEKPARSTTEPYRAVLERIWIVEPVPGWIPSRNRIANLATPPKHHLADPALAARLLNVGVHDLLEGRSIGPAMPRDGSLLGALFESLMTLSVRVYAQAAEARVHHLRTKGGAHEVDLIVVGHDGRVVAIEVKLTSAVNDEDCRHLRWLNEQLGDELADAVVISTGSFAYRRKDGIAVVPAALLGP
ncbi:MAG: ATP-binding protein [Acidimicrobiales bacterium]